MVRRSSATFRGRSAASPREDDEDASIATSRISLDAPGRTAKEMLASGFRGRKVYVEHHQKGTKPRHRSRAPSVEERNPRLYLDSPERRRTSSKVSSSKPPIDDPSRTSPKRSILREHTPEKHERRSRSKVSSPKSSESPRHRSHTSSRQGPPDEGTKKKSRTRSKSASRKYDRSRSSSPRKSSKREPLLQGEEEFKRSSSSKKRINKRIRSLKLRILDDDEDQGVPLYKPPIIPDHDSGDEASSSKWDKYSVTATPGDSVRSEKKDKIKSRAFLMKTSEVEAWEQIAREAETLTSMKDVSPRNKHEPQRSLEVVPPVEGPIDKQNLPLDPLNYSGSLHDDIESFSVWSQASQSEHNKHETRTYANETTMAVPSGVDEVEMLADKPKPAQPSKDKDGILDAPRKATSFSDMIKTRLSSRDVDSVRFIVTNSEELWSASEDGVVILKQRVAYLCIAVSAIQMGLLIIQLTLCGLASLNINPMIGPFPDAFSEWGGKNTYLLLEGRQYFRIITPIFLHVGVIHLLINAYCQLETCAFFEREWGSGRWLTIYLISGIGSVLTSSAIDPDAIGVCSSGALMGLFGAKIAQVVTWTFFELKSSILEESAKFDTLGGVLCSAAMVSLLSFFTYIDWSGHLGGLFAGFFIGMTLFAKPITSRAKRAIWGSLGILLMIAGSSIMLRVLLQTEPDEELGDACQYFRNLYPDGYVCECVWD